MLTPAAIQTPLTTTAETSPGRARLFVLVGIYMISLALLAWLFYDGLDYYLTPLAERAHHPDYRTLRPAGGRGLAYGIIGSAMMVLMLVYTLRKRTRWLGQFLSLPTVLDIHIYLGVIGPLFIVLHTSFKVQGLVAVSFWSMVAVAASGYFGRYLYSQIPHNISGAALSLQDMERDAAGVTKRLKDRFGLEEAELHRVEQLFERQLIPGERNALLSVFLLMLDDLRRPLVRRDLRRRLYRLMVLPKNQYQELFESSFQRALMRRRIALLNQTQKVFHFWHVIHKPFAIIMYVIMMVHIGIALWTGYAWFN